jgi:hypothetical protein
VIYVKKTQNPNATKGAGRGVKRRLSGQKISTSKNALILAAVLQ